MSELYDGYLFALHVLNSLGIDFNSKDVKKRVAAVADGHAILGNTPEVDLRMMKLNEPLPIDDAILLEMLRKNFDTYHAKNVLIARRICKEHRD